jgi:hypothetical protein
MTSRVLVLGVVVLLAMPLPVAAAGSLNGSGGDMPAYYDGQLFTINFKELPPNGEAAVLAQTSRSTSSTCATRARGRSPEAGRS